MPADGLRTRKPRPAMVKRLQKQIPRLNLTAIIVRIAQTILLFSLTLAYVMSDPGVFFDVFVWAKAGTVPYEITIHRSTTIWFDTRSNSMLWVWKSWSEHTFMWNDSSPFPGLAAPYTCVDVRYGCNGKQWAASRIGWLDSWPIVDTPTWMADTVYLDRYMFWLIVLGGFMGMGQSLVVFTHCIEPSGIGFYKYTASMDFLISIIFLLIGIFPIAILRHRQKFELATEPGSAEVSPIGLISDELERYQRCAFYLGWVLWGLYVSTFILNAFLAVGLRRYKKLTAVYPLEEDGESHDEVETSADVASTGVELGGRTQSANATLNRMSGARAVRLVHTL